VNELTFTHCHQEVNHVPAAIDPAPLAWMTEGACLVEDPELFFPVGEGGANTVQIERARSVCGRCHVRAECLRFALKTRVKNGVWGGYTEQERGAMIRDRRSSRSRRRPPRGPAGRQAR
jgi:WhiB family transcriptional regulator, redox-sensing transcriptional regulator